VQVGHNLWAAPTRKDDIHNHQLDDPGVVFGQLNGGFPIGGQTNVNIANNHLQYAFTWYSLAITLIVIYFVFHWRRGSKEEGL